MPGNSDTEGVDGISPLDAANDAPTVQVERKLMEVADVLLAQGGLGAMAGQQMKDRMATDVPMADHEEPAAAITAGPAAAADVGVAPDAGNHSVLFTKWRAGMLDRLELEEAKIEQAFKKAMEDACKLRADGLLMTRSSRSSVDWATTQFLLEGRAKIPNINF